jgi:hypothetical protein
MFRSSISTAAVLAVVTASVAVAEPVPSIVLPDGDVLDVQMVIGSGPYSSFEVVDFQDVGGPAFAWEYNYATPTPSDPAPNGYQLLEAIVAADPNFSMDATYYPEYFEHFVNNFTYGSYTGNSTDYWNYWNGSYDPIGQTVDWNYAESGPDNVTLSEDSFDGWVANNNAPNLPEIAVPEPGALALLGASCLLSLRQRREA